MEYPQGNTNIFNEGHREALPNATAVLALGIISIVGCLCYFLAGLLGITCGVISLVLASKDSRRYAASPQSYTISSYSNLKAGKICAIIGIIISSLWLIFVIFIIAIIGIAGLSHPEQWVHHYQSY